MKLILGFLLGLGAAWAALAIYQSLPVKLTVAPEREAVPPVRPPYPDDMYIPRPYQS